MPIALFQNYLSHWTCFTFQPFICRFQLWIRYLWSHWTVPPGLIYLILFINSDVSSFLRCFPFVNFILAKDVLIVKHFYLFSLNFLSIYIHCSLLNSQFKMPLLFQFRQQYFCPSCIYCTISLLFFMHHDYYWTFFSFLLHFLKFLIVIFNNFVIYILTYCTKKGILSFVTRQRKKFPLLKTGIFAA